MYNIGCKVVCALTEEFKWVHECVVGQSEVKD